MPACNRPCLPQPLYVELPIHPVQTQLWQLCFWLHACPQACAIVQEYIRTSPGSHATPTCKRRCPAGSCRFLECGASGRNTSFPSPMLATHALANLRPQTGRQVGKQAGTSRSQANSSTLHGPSTPDSMHACRHAALACMQDMQHTTPRAYCCHAVCRAAAHLLLCCLMPGQACMHCTASVPTHPPLSSPFHPTAHFILRHSSLHCWCTPWSGTMQGRGCG